MKSWEEFKHRLPTDTEYYSWLSSDWCNYGVIAGWGNLVVIDFDDIEIFNLWMLWTRTRSIDTQYVADKSFKVRTRRGMHVYVTAWERMENQKRKNIDIQAQGKYVVGPGCVHPSGHEYAPMGDMVFPIVFDIEQILPVDLFPIVSNAAAIFSGPAPTFTPSTTEYPYDPFAAASAGGDVDLISKVKSSIRIESLFGGLQKTSTDGRWYACVCPFHDDNHPSFWIDTRRQLCGCNVCGMKPMDVINLFSRMHHMPESDAVKELAETLGIWR